MTLLEKKRQINKFCPKSRTHNKSSKKVILYPNWIEKSFTNINININIKQQKTIKLIFDSNSIVLSIKVSNTWTKNKT